MAVLLCKTEIYEIYQSGAEELVFFAPRQKPPRAIFIDQNFSQGKVVGEFSNLKDTPFYPIQHTDIVFFSNWLANWGDLILHASGIAFDDRGYCFAGSSGVGKSTLADHLIAHENVTLLGEDQVILRNMDGRFWIYGTPWHEAPERCSPMGVPLERIFFLQQQEENTVKRITPFEGFKRLMQTAFIPYYRPQAVQDIMKTLSRLSETIPFSQMSFKLGTDPLNLILGD